MSPMPGHEGVGALAREGADATREPCLFAIDDGLQVDIAEARTHERPNGSDVDERRHGYFRPLLAGAGSGSVTSASTASAVSAASCLARVAHEHLAPADRLGADSVDARRDDERPVRIRLAGVRRREEVLRLRVHRGVAERRADEDRHAGVASIHQATFTFRRTAAARLDLSTTATGPISTSPVLTAPAVEKSGSQVWINWPGTATPWKPSMPNRTA